MSIYVLDCGSDATYLYQFSAGGRRGGGPGQSFLPRPARATTTGGGGLYTPNGSGLAPSAFLRLPPDAVQPSGWLSTQLQNQLSGLNGQMTYVSHFLQPSTRGWITPSQYGWEEAPYWLRGYANLGYVTGDAATISAARTWLTGTIATQQSNGFFGPDNVLTSLNGGFDPWPYMPMLRAITSYQEYSGDTSVVPFMSRFFGYLSSQPTSQISNGWGYSRWAEMMDSIIWLYNRTGNSSLLSLMTTIHQHSADWMTCGIVELMQSCEILTQVLGDPVWADRCEQLAFNMLPAALDPRQPYPDGGGPAGGRMVVHKIARIKG